MRRRWRWFAVLLLALLVLSSCGSDRATGEGPGGVEAGDDAAEQDAADQDVEAADGDQAQDEAEGSDLAGTGAEESERQVITTAYAAVEVDDTTEAVADLLGRLTGYGGYVEERSERTDTDGNPTRASLTLRLPAGDLPEMLEALDEVGEVSELTESAQDVTGTVRDLDARIEALETSVERLIEIMAEADSAEDLLQVETTLSQRQADLEALQAERTALGDQVAMSTLQVELSTEPIAEVETDGFLGGLQSGWNGLVSATNALLVVTGTLLPWLLVAALPALGLYLVLRRRRTRNPRTETSSAAPDSADQEPTSNKQHDDAGLGSRPNVEEEAGSETEGDSERPSS